MMRWSVVSALLVVSLACSETQVERVPERLILEPDALSFGRVVVHGEARRDLLVKNPGRARVSVEFAEAPEGFSIEPASFVVEPGGQNVVSVRFVPTAAGRVEGDLVLAFGRSKGSLRVDGTGVADALGVPGSLDFGWVTLGERRVLSLAIENRTDVDLEVEAVLPQEGPFSVLQERLRLQARGFGEMELVFAPEAEGEAKVALGLRVCSACREETVSLRGVGARYRLRAVPEVVDFGRVLPGARVERRVRLENPSAAPVTLLEPVWQPFFPVPPIEIDGLAPKLTLAPGESVELVFRYLPRQRGWEERSLQFFDHEEKVVLELPVRGRAGGPELRLFPERLDFGPRPAGVAFVRSIKIENVGDPESVRITDIRVEGPDESVFSVVHVELPLEVGTVPRDVLVTAVAHGAGLFAAEAVFETSSEFQPKLRLPLSIEAIEASACELDVWPKERNFGSVRPREDWGSWFFFEQERYEFVRKVYLMNRGTSDCVLWDFGIEGESARFYSFPQEPPALLVIRPGEEYELQIELDVSDAPEREVLWAELVFHVAGGSEPRRISLVGMRALHWDDALLNADWSFQATPVGRASIRPTPWFSHVSAIEFLPDSSESFFFANPFPMWEDWKYRSLLAFVPEAVGIHRGMLGVSVYPGILPHVIDIEAEAIPPCVSCDWPEPYCMQDMVVQAWAEIEFVDPEWEGGCWWGPGPGNLWTRYQEWRLSPGSGYSFGAVFYFNLLDLSLCSGSLHVYNVGQYTIGNMRYRSDGRAAYCYSTIEVEPSDGLLVEIFKDVKDGTRRHNPVAIVYGGDPANPATWESPENACWLERLTGWAHPCLLGGDAPLDAHYPVVNSEYGYEKHSTVIRVVEPIRSGVPYYFGVAEDRRAPDKVTVRVFCDKTEAFLGEISIVKDRFTVLGSVMFDESGGCTFTPDGVTSW